MTTIQFGGLATGLNTTSLIDSLVNVEQRGTRLLQAQKVRFQAQQGVYTSLASKLASLKSAAQALSLSVDFNRKSAVSSDTSVLTSDADSTAQLGEYRVSIDSLARAKSVQSASFTATTDSLGTGTLTITVGATSVNVPVDATNNTLAGLKDAINNSGADVTASIINVGASGADYRLVVQGKSTGTANALSITGTLAGGVDPFVNGGDIVQSASDAVFSVNGLAVTRSSNVISDVIPGVTFTLLKEGDRNGTVDANDLTSSITVSTNTASVKSSIQKLVDAYNEVVKLVNDQFKVDPESNRQGTLGGDSVLRGAMSRIRATLSSAGGVAADIRYLSDIGIRFEKDGTLTLDDAKLNDALVTNPEGVSSLFLGSQNGFGKRLPAVIDGFIHSVSGALTARQKGITESITGIDKKIEREAVRLLALEKRLTEQFAALERLVSQLNGQAEFLARQLTFLNRS